MTKNRAASRHAKELRRKTVVAERKRQENFAVSTAGIVAAAARLPIQHCLIMDGWERQGMGHVWLARGATPYELTVALFLVDTMTFGVKDVFVRNWNKAEFEDARHNIAVAGSMKDIPPADARKFLRDVVQRFQAEGVPPHRDYRTVERLFGDVDADRSTFVTNFETWADRFQRFDDDGDGDGDGAVIEGEVVEITTQDDDAERDVAITTQGDATGRDSG